MKILNVWSAKVLPVDPIPTDAIRYLPGENDRFVYHFLGLAHSPMYDDVPFDRFRWQGRDVPPGGWLVREPGGPGWMGGIGVYTDEEFHSKYEVVA